MIEGDTMKIHLSKKINFDRENKIEINNIFNKAIRNENIFDIYNVDKHMRYPIIHLHCILIESPVVEPPIKETIDVNELTIEQHLQIREYYEINRNTPSRTYRIYVDELIKL